MKDLPNYFKQKQSGTNHVSQAELVIVEKEIEKLSSPESSTIKIFLELVKSKWVNMLEYMAPRLLFTFLKKSIHKYTFVRTSINNWKKKRQIKLAKHHLKRKVAGIC